MTKILLAISLFLTSLFPGYINQDKNDHNKAAVTYEKGIYFFVESIPADPYIELGTIKAGLTFSGQYNELKSDILKKCLKNYPGADGLIFNTAEDCSRAIAIKFK